MKVLNLFNNPMQKYNKIDITAGPYSPVSFCYKPWDLFYSSFSSYSRRNDPIYWSNTNMGLHLRSWDFLEFYYSF